MTLNMQLTFRRYIPITLMLVSSIVFANDLEFGIQVRAANPEYGSLIPKQLCLHEKTSPCRLPVFLLYDQVSDISRTKDKLSLAAYTALQQQSENAQVVWEFNLCKPKWDKRIACVEMLGYLVVKNHEVVFYTFQSQSRK